MWPPSPPTQPAKCPKYSAPLSASATSSAAGWKRSPRCKEEGGTKANSSERDRETCKWDTGEEAPPPGSVLHEGSSLLPMDTLGFNLLIPHAQAKKNQKYIHTRHNFEGNTPFPTAPSHSPHPPSLSLLACQWATCVSRCRENYPSGKDVSN